MADGTHVRAAYQEISDHFRAEIIAGRITDGDPVPPQRDLMEQWGVSNGTVDRAMFDLQTDGLIQRARGRQRIFTKPPETVLDWDSIRETVIAMHDEIETEYVPDVVLTMSGPGGFAAFLTMARSGRHVPVLAAVTFPARNGTISRAETTYRKAAKLDTWKILETGKWRIYLPRTLAKYPEHSRVLIFDDRVMSGTSQRLARDHLEAEGLDVRTAALVVSTDNVMNVDYFGVIIDDSFQMPWGTNRGRQ